MRISPAKSFGFSLLLGFAVWGLAGCATQRPAPAFIATSTQQGVIRWQQEARALTGDAIFSRNAQGAVQMQWGTVKKSPALAITLTSEGWLTASGSLADRHWAGPMARAPRSLSSWATFLTTYQHAASLSPGFQEIHTPAYRMAYEKTSLGLLSLSVASADFRESIAAALVPPTSVPPAPAPDFHQPEENLDR